jgi:4-hydroxybenzoate polyprenyltransferase
MPLRRKLLLLLASARVANLPSVVCNVWLGVALGVLFCPALPPATYWPAALQLAVAGILLYVAGTFLNDWHDRHWDAQHRPERALPQGAFGSGLYLGLAVCCGLAGVAVAAGTSAGSGGVAALIVGCVLIYTRHHKQTAWAVLMMGSCRALLPLLFLIEWPLGGMWTGASPGGTPHQLLLIATPALALMLYIAALSWLARAESVAPPPAANRLDGRLPLALSGLVMAAVFLRHDPLLGMLGLLPFAAWLGLCFTRYRRPLPMQISALLAGLPLLDWVFLLPLSFGLISHGQANPFYLTCLLLPPLAVLSGRCLQRLAAAT